MGMRQDLEQWSKDTEEELLFADGFDKAIVGLGEQYSRTTAVVYDYNKCVEVLMTRDKMSRDEAIEYMEFNVVTAYVGEKTPIFLTTCF
jgi:hypothetical protein